MAHYLAKSNDSAIDTANSDGSSYRMDEDDLDEIKRYIQEMAIDFTNETRLRVDTATDIRYCTWPGQHPDGKKHKSREMPNVPFEGASDVRVRSADMVCNWVVSTLCSAAQQAAVGVSGLEATDDPLAASLQHILRHLRDRHLGSSYRTELERLANYQVGSSPGVGFLGIYWDEQVLNRAQTVTVQEVIELIATDRQMNEEQLQALGQSFAQQDEEAVLFHLESLFGSLKRKTLRKAAQELLEFGGTRLPIPQVKGRLCMRARRLFYHVFVPVDCAGLEEHPIVFEREWLSRFELRQRKYSHGYEDKWISEVEERKGGSAFSFLEVGLWDGIWDRTQFYTRLPDDHQHSNRYEIITVYHKASDKNGIPGCYRTVFHGEVDFPAGPSELLDYPDGKLPFIAFANESVTPHLLDSRSIPEIVGPDQAHQKAHIDAATDNASRSALPPLLRPKNRPDFPTDLGPGSQIPVSRSGDVQYLEPPEFPRASMEIYKETAKRVREYYGMPHPDLDPSEGRVRVQMMVDNFLANLADGWKMALGLAIEAMPDEEISRIINRADVDPEQLRDAVRTGYDLVFEWRVENQDLELLQARLELYVALMTQIDREGTILSAPLVAHFVRLIDPSLAEKVLQPADEASRREIEDEQMNLLKIAGGVPVQHEEDGQNFQLRLQYIEQLMQQSPAYLEGLDSEFKVTELQKRVDHLRFMNQQTENAQIGRIGVQETPGA